MTRGRKPKPTELKLLAGNPGKRPITPSEPKPKAPDKKPYALRFLNDEAQKEWRRIIEHLMEMGLYTEVDQAALAMYCQAWGRWVEAERMVNEQGAVLVSEETGNFYQNPWFHTANRAWEQLRKMLPEFGFTPSSRARLKVAPAQEQDELDVLLKRRAGGGR